jgi:hypothetical protein
MSQQSEEIMMVARDKARRRTRSQRVGSAIAGKFETWKKPRVLAKTLATAAIQAIPIPGVGALADWGKEKLNDYFKARWDAHRLNEARAQQAANPGLDSDYKVLKFDIKNLEIDQLDKSRQKVMEQMKLYNQFAVKQDSTCARAYNLAYRLERVQFRTDKLAALAGVLIQIGEDLLRFCNEVAGILAQARRRLPDEIDFILLHPKCGSHCLGEAKNKAEFDRAVEGLGGHLKTGHSWTGQNRPTEFVRD